MTQTKKLRILVSAYACEPGKGSEPGVGWNWIKQIARFADSWVITRANNRMVIENEIQNNPIHGLHFVYVDLPRWAMFWKKGQRGVHLYYYLWQLKTYFIAKMLIRNNRFDIAHHLTFGVFSYPSALSLLNIPFVWGPVGGIDRVPKGLMSDIGLRGRLFEFVRDFSHKAFFYFDPFVRLTAHKAKIVLCRTKETHLFFCRCIGEQRVALMLETGAPHIPKITDNPKTINKCKVFFAGRLIPLKGVTFALKSFKIFADRHTKSFFEIAGSGYEKKRLEESAKQMGIFHKVAFLGEQPREIVLRMMNDCDIFLYPSLREGGTWALMEAMALGKPVVCLDHSGPGAMVTDDCGIKVKPINPDQTIQDFAKALIKLANDPDLRRTMGEAGRKRVEEHFSWDKKGEFIYEIYMKVLGIADPSGS